MKRSKRVFTLLAAMLIALGACTSGEETVDTTVVSDETETTQEAPPTTAESVTSSTEAQGGGGTLHVGTLADFRGGFDPFFSAFEQYSMIPQIYDALIHYDHQLNASPALAETWEISPEQDSVTLSLRQGVSFHSGNPFNADAVVANYERAMDPETGGLMLGYAGDVESVMAVDEYTVQIDLIQPLPELAITDFLEFVRIIDPAAFDVLETEGVGTGPFVFESWEPNQSLALNANPDYWGGAPNVDRIEYQIFDDPDALMAAYQSGAVDIAFNIPFRNAADLPPENAVQGHPGTFTYGFWMRSVTPPFDNKNVRHAFQLATNRDGMAEAVLFGFGQPTALPWSTESPAYDPASLDRWGFDLDRAAELLEQAASEGAPMSAEILLSSGFPETIQFAQILQSDLASIGFDLEVTTLDPSEQSARYVAKDYQAIATFAGDTAKYPTRITGNSIYRLVDNRSWADENGEGSPPQAYVDAITNASGALTEADQEAAFVELREVLEDEAWVVSIAYNNVVYAVADGVSGLETTVDSMLILEDVSLEG